MGVPDVWRVVAEVEASLGIGLLVLLVIGLVLQWPPMLAAICAGGTAVAALAFWAAERLERDHRREQPPYR